MTHKYEVLVLTVPEITQDEIKQIENDVERVVNGIKGSVISFERWGKFKLVYPVRGNDYGVYFLVRFEIPSTGSGEAVKSVRDLFMVKLNTIVMRHMISRLEDGRPLTYQRPKSLEEMPTSRDMSSFLKENQMEGLLYSVDSERDGESEQDMSK